jgi:hypothetical protein
MYRFKIGLIAAGLVLVSTCLFYLAVTSDLRTSATQDADARVARAQRLNQQMSRLMAVDLANLATERAAKTAVRAIFEKSDETALRQAAFTECEVINDGLQKQGRKADIVAIMDASGKIVARDLNPNADYGEVLRGKYPAVEQALKGQAITDIWTWQGRVHTVSLAPVVRADGSVAGGLMLAWVVSAKTAQETRDLLGAEIGYFHKGKVHASSFVLGADPSKEDVGRTQSLGKWLFEDSKLAMSNKASEVMRVVIEGGEYSAIVAPMPGNFADKTSGFVVLASRGEGLARLQMSGAKVIYLGIMAVFVVLVGVAMTARRFVKPLDQIELGVGEVINGNIDYSFKPVGPDFEGLSNSLNVMLARLLGRAEPDDEAVEEEEDAAGKRWKADAMVIQETDGSAPAPVVAALAQESEAAYFPRLYNEYVSALRTVGQPSDGVSVLAFMAKLSLAEAGLRERWECKSVRFQVVTAGPSVSLRPIKIA